MFGIFSNARTLTGKLALFFTVMSCVIGVLTFLLFYYALQWSEDRVGERRILIDRDSAVERFTNGEHGVIKLDTLTTAYNDEAQVPEPFKSFLKNKNTYLGEVDTLDSPSGHMVFKGVYTQNGQQKDIVVLSFVDKVEFSREEMAFVAIVVIIFIALLMFVFGAFLFKVSKKLIEPVNELAHQLNDSSGDATRAFKIGKGAVGEFQLLTTRLNQYRKELRLVLKREQAFARYASHELRTPLTIVKGANNLLSRSELTEGQERQVARINDAVSEMIKMVDALLSIVRYERNSGDIEVRDVDKSEIIRIVEANNLHAVDKQIRINVDFRSSPKIKASQAILSMVVGNILRNACAASQKREVDILVNDNAIEVIDDGAGLSSESSKSGHGLGLLIVDDLCRRYGWQFSLQPHESRGCRAIITFT